MPNYKTITAGGEAEYEIQRSRFLTHTAHVESEQEAQEFIHTIKKKYFDARHNCSAWILGAKSSLQKSHDDGEPGGKSRRGPGAPGELTQREASGAAAPGHPSRAQRVSTSSANGVSS